MDWQALELLKVVVLIVLAIGLHQFIRAFGKNYTASIFESTPEIERNFRVLADVAYYLIFAAFVLFNVHFEKVYRTLPNGSRVDVWADQVNAAQLGEAVSSIAGICLVIGILHFVVYFAIDGQKIWLITSVGEYQVGFFLTPVAAICNILANRFIRRDEKLVRSVDRIR